MVCCEHPPPNPHLLRKTQSSLYRSRPLVPKVLCPVKLTTRNTGILSKSPVFARLPFSRGLEPQASQTFPPKHLHTFFEPRYLTHLNGNTGGLSSVSYLSFTPWLPTSESGRKPEPPRSHCPVHATSPSSSKPPGPFRRKL